MNTTKTKLTKSGYRYILMNYLAVAINMIVLFIVAGTIKLPRVWFCYGLVMASITINMTMLCIVNPDLVNQRGEKKKDTKKFDKIFYISWIPLKLMVPVAAGIELGRLNWNELHIFFAAGATLFFIMSSIFVDWAMYTNRHFESTVRIQNDRDHQVIATGPYRIVRHPGYAGGIIAYLAMPLIMGSVLAFIPMIFTIALLIVRTALEDKTLQNELKGYKEFTKKTKYRLFPGIW